MEKLHSEEFITYF